LKEFNQILEALTLVGYFLPLAIVVIRKLSKDLPVLMFACYWALAGLLNVADMTISPNQYEIFRMVFNIVDLPFVLFIFYLNSEVPYLKATCKFLIPVYLVIEILNGIIFGFNDDAFKYFLGTGVVIVIVSVVIETIHYFQKMNHNGRQKALGFLYLAVLFEYSLYIVYYLYEYFLRDIDVNKDRYLIYDWSTVIGIIIACFGFLSGDLPRKFPPAQQVSRKREVLINILD
jgi:hypothetical protein